MVHLNPSKSSHKNGIIHQDVKPQNFIVTEDGTVKIFDFDISEFTFLEAEDEESKTMGFFLGTPKYAAPEQSIGFDDCNHRIDIYAVGLILYEMIADTFPFSSEDFIESLYERRSIMPAKPSVLNPEINVPESLENVVMKALATDPDDRYQTIQEMCDAIQNS